MKVAVLVSVKVAVLVGVKVAVLVSVKVALLVGVNVEVGVLAEAVWQAWLPESVNVLPASGTNCQS